MKIAIVHDWLTTLGGAERVVLELHKQYPDAPVYTSVYDPEALPEFSDVDVRTTWLQKMPFKLKHKLFAGLRPFAFRSLDLSEYDIVISSSSAESKHVKTRKDAVHISYCHTPIRYYWSHYHQYMIEPGLGFFNPIARFVLPLIVVPLRWLDKIAAQKVDYFIANSHEVQKRIKKYYHRDSEVIFPPVSIQRFAPDEKTKRKGFIIAGRQIPYKRFDLAIKACSELDVPLTVVGDGSEHESLKTIAGDSVTFTGRVSDEEMVKLFHSHEAFIFPAEEDFGIIPIEAMSAGLPVIAFKKAGALDYVVDGKTGIFFNHQTIMSLKKALQKFDSKDFKQSELLKHVEAFSDERFRLEISEFVREKSNS